MGTLGVLPRPRFLVYLMGPYEAFDVTEVNEIDPTFDAGDAGLDLLVYVRDRLREAPGVNAFLAIDVDEPLSEMDAATQSVEFASASNAVVYVVPRLGDNLGVGIEVGTVLEVVYRAGEDEPRAGTNEHRERVLFVHESGVTGAMIAAVGDRWEARVSSYLDREDLIRQVRLFVRDVARRELRGELSTLD